MNYYRSSGSFFDLNGHVVHSIYIIQIPPGTRVTDHTDPTDDTDHADQTISRSLRPDTVVQGSIYPKKYRPS